MDPQQMSLIDILSVVGGDHNIGVAVAPKAGHARAAGGGLITTGSAVEYLNLVSSGKKRRRRRSSSVNVQVAVASNGTKSTSIGNSRVSSAKKPKPFLPPSSWICLTYL